MQQLIDRIGSQSKHPRVQLQRLEKCLDQKVITGRHQDMRRSVTEHLQDMMTYAPALLALQQRLCSKHVACF